VSTPHKESRILLAKGAGVETPPDVPSFEVFGLAADSAGNIQATDFNGRRILKFVP
jgi:hypothetical protein